MSYSIHVRPVRTFSSVTSKAPRTFFHFCVEDRIEETFAHISSVSSAGTDQDAWSDDVQAEYDELVSHMDRFAILPAGRHLWATGVKGRQFLFNCHVSGWGTERLSRHYEFTFLRLVEGGGVGANYSSRFLKPFGAPRRELRVHIVCDPMHQDYEEMMAVGVLSEECDSDWAGAFEVEDSREGWADALVDLIDTFMTDRDVRHADRVYDVSRVRCRGSRLKTFGGTASGPGPFARMMIVVASVLSGAAGKGRHLSPVEAMEIEHRIAECVVSGGVRRSARMSICHWADPFIAEFLACKQDTALHWTTNVSVEIDDRSIQALNEVTDTRYAEALAVHRAVVSGMLADGEPGYWNSTYSNEGEINEVIATNPCGEIALPSAGACVLGHVNLDAFAPQVKGASVDHKGLHRAHELMTRFLIRATYGDMTDDEQRGIMHSERRIGVGHFGVQGFLAKQGIRYSQAPFAPPVPRLAGRPARHGPRTGPRVRLRAAHPRAGRGHDDGPDGHHRQDAGRHRGRPRHLRSALQPPYPLLDAPPRRGSPGGGVHGAGLPRREVRLRPVRQHDGRDDPDQGQARRRG